jgi:uncharacterized protein YpuA (DUF1002 family)
MNKKSYNIQMSYDISDDQKIKANQSLLHFDNAIKHLDMAKNHLNLMKNPFEEDSNMSPEDVMKTRAALRRFRDKVIDNFNVFKKSAFQCVNIMQEFSSDTQTMKLMKSFISTIDDLEIRVNSFSDLFQDLQAKDFAEKIIKSISSIQEQCDEIENIIEERVKHHIQENVLAANWVDSMSADLNTKIEKKTPLMLKLYNDRQEQMKNAILNRRK